MTHHPSIVVLASRSQTSYALIHALAAHFDIQAVIFEQKPFRKMLRYRLRTLGAWVVLQQLVFMVYDRLIIRPRSQALIAQLLAGTPHHPPDAQLRCIDVARINSDEVRALLAELAPACVVVSGTGIIGKKVLALAPTFLNIHVGITPRYRGVHGGFWAIVEGQPQLAGVTVHQVDAGVDTGSVVGQALIDIDPQQDTFRTLPVKQYLAGVPLMIAAVQAALVGSLTEAEPLSTQESRQWYSPTPTDYVRFVRQLWRLKAQS